MKSILFLSLPALLLLNGCIFKIDDDYNYKCHKPIYMDYKTLREMPAIEAPRDIKSAGKIYVWNNTLFVNEPNKGIHVIDISDKSAPQKLSFIKLPGNIDIAVKDGYLYADSFIDLVVLDVHDVHNITRVHREEEVFAYNPRQAIKNHEIYLCSTDPKKGVVIGYKE
ncbi:MAG: hypothetical protein DSZ05_06565 [Sulfurospirillum sp.]|nr:MAG: hypothetical protein DSZ05_06565 [Sulfurospirillum sp.]